MLEQAAFLAEVALGGAFVLVEDQPADLGAEPVGLARVGRQRFAQAQLGQARAVERAVSK